MSFEKELALAEKRAKEKLSFYYHLIVYLIVNAFLLAINLLQGGKLWFFYPLLGWLSGILIHAFFTYSRQHTRYWQRMVEKELNVIKRDKDIRK